MKKILTAVDMKKVDNYSINEIGIPSLALMERASAHVACEIENDLGNDIAKIDVSKTSIVAICGIGNNGADGVCAARILKSLGYYDVTVVIVGNINKATDEFITQLNIARKLDVSICAFAQWKQNNNKAYNIIIDALFGIGLARKVEGDYREAIESINEIASMFGAKVYAVDIPSGIDGGSGNVLGVAVNAYKTVTFDSIKSGLLLTSGFEHAGEIVVKNIGFPKVAYENVSIISSYDEEDLKDVFPKRADYSNKGTFGKVLILAGNEDMYGALEFATGACVNLGVGLIKIVTTNSNKSRIFTKYPEVIVNSIHDNSYSSEDEEIVSNAIKWCDVILVGPGMGVSDRTKDIVEKCLLSKKPCVIDADGINTLSMYEDIKSLLHEDVIITPHMGEASRFKSMKIDEIKQDMIGFAKGVSSKNNVNIILKDAKSVIVNTKGEIFINKTGNNGMATAGSGDVLAGITVALLGYGYKPTDASVIAPFLHGMAGDYARKEKGIYAMRPGDMTKALESISKLV